VSNLEDRKICAEFEVGTTLGVAEVLDEPDYPSDPAAACSLLPRLLQMMVRQHGLHEGHYLARQFWLDLLEKSNSLTWEDELCRLIVEAVRRVRAMRQPTRCECPDTADCKCCGGKAARKE
jgi:hypothetical protein